MKSIIISIVMLFSLDIYAQNLYQDGKIVKEWRETYEMSITKLHEDRKKNN